jgi:hypothetical protein
MSATWEKSTLSGVLGKLLGPKKEDVTLTCTNGIMWRFMMGTPFQSQAVKWYGHVAMAGEDRNIYTSNAETCG